MASNFKKLLITMQNESMENQMIAIKKAFDDWKAGEEQIDDVCVIGIRL